MCVVREHKNVHRLVVCMASYYTKIIAFKHFVTNNMLSETEESDWFIRCVYMYNYSTVSWKGGLYIHAHVDTKSFCLIVVPPLTSELSPATHIKS